MAETAWRSAGREFLVVRFQILMRIITFILGVATMMLSGCATTSKSSSSEWNARSIGQGIQIGAAGSSGNPLSGIVWGVGFLVEQIGGAMESAPPPSGHDDEIVH